MEDRGRDQQAGSLHGEDQLESVADLVSGVNVGHGVFPQAMPEAQGDDAVDVLGGHLWQTGVMSRAVMSCCEKVLAAAACPSRQGLEQSRHMRD